MKALLAKLAPYAGAAAIVLVVWAQLRYIAVQNATISTYADILAAQQVALNEIKAGIKRSTEDLRKLAATQEGFRSALEERRIDIEALKRENEDFRRWADADLPEPVARMRERPAITGADGYAEYLRARGPVRAIGEPGDAQRRPERDH